MTPETFGTTRMPTTCQGQRMYRRFAAGSVQNASTAGDDQPHATARTSAGSVGPAAQLANARADHYRAFPRMHRIRLHRLWVILHLAIVLYGLSLLSVCVAKV